MADWDSMPAADWDSMPAADWDCLASRPVKQREPLERDYPQGHFQALIPEHSTREQRKARR